MKFLPNEEFFMIRCGHSLYDKSRKDDDRAIDHIKHWYYYQGHILGTYWKNGVLGYFIFQKGDCEGQTFTDTQAFERKKEQWDLSREFGQVRRAVLKMHPLRCVSGENTKHNG